MSESKHKQHLDYQAAYFNSKYHVFRQAIPSDVVERTRTIVQSVDLNARMRVLDVGTGMGVLIQYFLESGVKPENIVGCDLSEEMLAEARRRYPHVAFWQGDFLQLPADFGTFDAVFFNACFGNFFDQETTAKAAAAKLKPNGKLVISHPMGNRFVRKLKEDDPRLVLSELPEQAQLQQWLPESRIVEFKDEPDLYLAIVAIEK